MSIKINKRQFKLWIAALDSGKYKQAKYYLQQNDAHCCLGVACELFIPEDKIKRLLPGCQMYGQRPADQPAAPEWLKEINNDFTEKAKVDIPLTMLNDTGIAYGYLHPGSEAIEPFTFPEIATLLELVYVHKILD